MRTIIKIMLAVLIAVGLMYHLTWYRGYFAIGGEVLIAVAVGAILIGGEINGKRKKQSRSNC